MKQTLKAALVAVVLVLSSMTVVVGTTVDSSAATTCDFVKRKVNKKVVAKHKICQGWNGTHKGAQIYATYSDWRYWSRNWAVWPAELLFNVKIKDTKKDGKCASLWIERRDSAMDFLGKSGQACGKGKVAHLAPKFSQSGSSPNWDMIPGYYYVRICVAATDCKVVWAQQVLPKNVDD